MVVKIGNFYCDRDIIEWEKWAINNNTDRETNRNCDKEDWNITACASIALIIQINY